jgi:hypothetical protein
MTPRTRLGLSLTIVGLLFVFHVHLKTAKIFANPTWDAKDEVGQFWSEFAFHYRFAKFFAENSDWSQLNRDRSVQYPDTINDWAEFTVAMEVPAGVLYRWFQPAMPFHVWIVWYDCLVSSLSLFAVFFLARALWRSDAAGVFAAALYATLYPSYGRTVKNLFLREDFAIPLIIFALFFTVRALQEQKVRDQILAGIFWLAALASWHLTQFVLAVVIGAAVLVYLGKGDTPRVPWFVIVLAAGSVITPVLRAKQLFISPTFSVMYALALAVWINGGRKRAAIVFGAWLVVLVGLSLWLQKSQSEYAHVYELFFAKLRFLGVKPDDPAKLPCEARCLWESAFNTAERTEWWHSLGWCLPLAVVAGWRVGRMEVWKAERSETRPSCAANVFVVFALLLVPLSWMVVRYFTFLSFAVAVVAAGLMTNRVYWRTALLGATVWQFCALNYRPMDRTPVVPDNYKPVVAWINEHTPTNAVILASIAESPVVLAYTGRPTILHSKFENKVIRDRYREFLAAIYGSQELFDAFAKKYGADYFVFDNGFLVASKDSRRYKADKLGDLDPSCAAMQFYERSNAVFSANGYTVFRLAH